MKIILYSQSSFVSLKMLFDDYKHEIKFRYTNFQDEINSEVLNKTEFGKEIMESIGQGKGIVTKENGDKLWSIVLNKTYKCEYLFIEIPNSKLVLVSLLEIMKKMGLGFEMVLNLFLNTEVIKSKTKLFLKTYEDEESMPEEYNIQLVLDQEKDRLILLNEFIDSEKIVKVDADCTQEELESRIANVIY